MSTKRALAVAKVNKVEDRVASFALHGSKPSMFARCPTFIVTYYDFVEKFKFKPTSHIEYVLTIGNLGLLHDETLFRMLHSEKRRKHMKADNAVVNWLLQNNMTRSVLASMGVYRMKNQRGKKQWCCTLTVNGVKSVTTHETYDEGRKYLKYLKELVANGTFVELHRKVPLTNLVFGPCTVDEGEEGERCHKSIHCALYGHCLNESWKYDIKGWRISDTTK